MRGGVGEKGGEGGKVYPNYVSISANVLSQVFCIQEEDRDGEGEPMQLNLVSMRVNLENLMPAIS